MQSVKITVEKSRKLMYNNAERGDNSKMTDNLPRSIWPARFQILSGSALKLLAILTMLIDHTGFIILSKCPGAMQPLFYLGEKGFSLYRISRDIGRMAFPIYAFLLVEGFMHTKNRKMYAWSLFLFACISELPWNYAHTYTLHYEKQNVFFTLFLGFMAYCALEYFWENQRMQLLCILGLFTVSWYLKADYGWKGFIFLLIMYWFRYEKLVQAVVGSSWLYYEWKACFAYIFINMYNGKRGFIKGKALKYFFYAFYPVHLLLLALICRYVLLL